MSTKDNPAVDEAALANEVKELILKKYPVKVARKRARQIMVNKVEGDQVPEIKIGRAHV